MKKTSRFIVEVVCVALGVVLAGSLFESAHPATYNWKLASVLPASHPVHQALVMFADKVKEKTKGEVTITVFPAGQLGQEKDYIEGAQLGSIEMTKVSSAPLGQFSKSLQVVSLPFIWKDPGAPASRAGWSDWKEAHGRS